jgi:nicotinamidase-related amidase
VSGTTPATAEADDGWLVVVDPQVVFASPEASPWGSPLWAAALPRVRALVEAFGERVVVTRFVADPRLGGSWEDYYRAWPFALVPDEDPLYAVVPELADVAEAAGRDGRLVTEPTFGKWTPALREVVGDRPRLTLAGVSTDCCVIATALAAADAGARVRVAADACAGSSPEAAAHALAVMALFAPQVTVV